MLVAPAQSLEHKISIVRPLVFLIQRAVRAELERLLLMMTTFGPRCLQRMTITARSARRA